jgi:hypothetical protein
MAFLKRALVLLTAVFALLGASNATQVMHRPANASAPLRKFKIEENAHINVVEKRATGKVQIGPSCFVALLSVTLTLLPAYFTNWGIYA